MLRSLTFPSCEFEADQTVCQRIPARYVSVLCEIVETGMPRNSADFMMEFERVLKEREQRIALQQVENFKNEHNSPQFKQLMNRLFGHAC